MDLSNKFISIRMALRSRIGDKSVSFHQKNLQLLAIEIFKSKTGVSPEFKNQFYIRKKMR